MTTIVTGERLRTKRELAELLRLSTRSIDRKISRGEIPPGIKLYGAVRWRQATIDAWIAAGCPQIESQSEKKGREQ